jgi:hypothetical protein
MINPAIKHDIEQQLARLPVEMQRRVLEYVVTLASGHQEGTKGSDLLKHAGSISEEDAQEMRRAIEDCERIDYDEW